MHMRHVTLEVRFEQKDPRVTHARWGSSFRAGKKDMMIFDFSLIDPHEAFYCCDEGTKVKSIGTYTSAPSNLLALLRQLPTSYFTSAMEPD